MEDYDTNDLGSSVLLLLLYILQLKEAWELKWKT